MKVFNTLKTIFLFSFKMGLTPKSIMKILIYLNAIGKNPNVSKLNKKEIKHILTKLEEYKHENRN